jgi:hypothetical protein
MGMRAEAQAPTMKAAARDTARKVKGIPVDTGRLSASVEVISADNDGFVVGSKVPYAKFVFGGTRYVKARPPDVPSDVGSRTSYALMRGIVHRS